MAVYDEESQRVVVEVVYDGPALAGKTTNLKQLCSFFTAHRRSELYTTKNATERTVYLDWLQLEGGVVAGRKLRCQLITVPGQTVLSRRRWQLLKRADVIVFVLESTRRGVDDALGMFETVRRYAQEGARDVPLLVQANKQDMPGALPPQQVAKMLGVEPGHVIPAHADSGAGVRETVVVAIRAVADSVQRRVLEEGLDALIGKAENGEEIQRLIEEEERRNPKSLLAIMMEHAPEALTARSRPEPEVERSSQASTDTVESSQSKPGSEARLEPEHNATRATQLVTSEEADEAERSSATSSNQSHEPPQTETVSAALPAVTAGDRELPGATDAEAPPSTASGEPVMRPARDTLPTGVHPKDAPMLRVRPLPVVGSLSGPPLPEPNVPSGFVWPAVGGRDILRQIPLAQAVQCGGQASHELANTHVLIYEAGPWCLKTSPRRCYPSLEAARDALLLLARHKIALKSMLVDKTVLALCAEASGAHWLWTVTPWLTTLNESMISAKQDGDQARLEQALLDYAGAVLESLKLAVRHNVQLDLHPSNFARTGTALAYVDDDILAGEQPPRLGEALLSSLEDFSEFPEAVNAYAGRLVGGLKEELLQSELALLGLRDTLQTIDARSEPVRDLRGRLLEVAC